MRACGPRRGSCLYEINRRGNSGEVRFPVLSYQAKVTMVIDCGNIEVPLKARRHLAALMLKDLVDSLDEEELISANAPGFTVQTDTPSPSELALRRTDGWMQPNGLALRMIKAAPRRLPDTAATGSPARTRLSSVRDSTPAFLPPPAGDSGHRGGRLPQGQSRAASP